MSPEFLGLPPGVEFYPDGDELVKLYLVPRISGEPDPFPGVILDDDAACSVLPWKLFKRHGLWDADEAYFYVRTTSDAAALADAPAPPKENARANRRCDDGRATWTSQKCVRKDLVLASGEKIRWSRNALNLHVGAAKSGSTGWVMHEYTITSPPCPYLKVCHIAFTGHGQKRMREPDDFHGEPVPVPVPVAMPAPVDAAAEARSSSCYVTATFDQSHCAAAPCTGQEPLLPELTDEASISDMVRAYLEFEEQTTAEQKIEQAMLPQAPMVQESDGEEHLGDHEFFTSIGVDPDHLCD
ncbi:hypothetical protein ACP4OV_012724 [Aristida adscensionis]